MYFQANYETSWEIISQCSRLYDLAETPSMRCAVLSTLSSAQLSPDARLQMPPNPGLILMTTFRQTKWPYLKRNNNHDSEMSV